MLILGENLKRNLDVLHLNSSYIYVYMIYIYIYISSHVKCLEVLIFLSCFKNVKNWNATKLVTALTNLQCHK